MKEEALWTLFFETGLPEAYLGLCGQKAENRQQRQRAEGRPAPQRSEEHHAYDNQGTGSAQCGL